MKNRVVESRMKLRERKLAAEAQREEPPQGSGPPNRHGMPKLPPGQTPAKRWPVLDLGKQPGLTQETWSLRLDGACARPRTLRWADFIGLEQVEEESDFHCVTGWSRMDMRWSGVRFARLVELAEPRPGATHVLCHGADGYSTNLPLEEALKPDVLLVHRVEGDPLPREHGGPVRMITPQLYAWKGAKWIIRIEFLEGDRPGYWEQAGYSNTADPWREERFNPDGPQAPPRPRFPWWLLLAGAAALAAIWLPTLHSAVRPFEIRTASAGIRLLGR